MNVQVTQVTAINYLTNNIILSFVLAILHTPAKLALVTWCLLSAHRDNRRKLTSDLLHNTWASILLVRCIISIMTV